MALPTNVSVKGVPEITANYYSFDLDVRNAPTRIAPPPKSVAVLGMMLKMIASPTNAATGSRYSQTAAFTASTFDSAKFQRKYPNPEQTTER